MRLFLTCYLLSLHGILGAMPGFHVPWGVQADLHIHPGSLPAKASHFSVAAWTAQQIISFHQHILSPVDGPRSHYRPSSSQYMSEAIDRHGFVMGFIYGCDRLLRENSDSWVYPTIEWDGHLYKWNPPPP